MASLPKLLGLEPQYYERTWGGRRLKPSGGAKPIGEIWCAYGKSRVADGPEQGREVGDLVAEHGAALLGAKVAARFGQRFPLLIKLLDCADWLSIQVHPNDEQAVALEGPGQFGKTEAWHFLAADSGSVIYAGTLAGTTQQQLEVAIRSGKVQQISRSIAVHPGETYLLHAGTMHALGPGLVLYEVQQSSDITYRVFDWDRPASEGRALHIEQAVAVTDAARQAIPTSTSAATAVPESTVVSCTYFVLDLVNLAGDPAGGDTRQETFHVLTVKDGAVDVSCEDATLRLDRYETVLVPAAAGRYQIRALDGKASVLRAHVPSA